MPRPATALKTSCSFSTNIPVFWYTSDWNARSVGRKAVRGLRPSARTPTGDFGFAARTAKTACETMLKSFQSSSKDDAKAAAVSESGVVPSGWCAAVAGTAAAVVTAAVVTAAVVTAVAGAGAGAAVAVDGTTNVAATRAAPPATATAVTRRGKRTGVFPRGGGLAPAPPFGRAGAPGAPS